MGIILIAAGVALCIFTSGLLFLLGLVLAGLGVYFLANDV